MFDAFRRSLTVIRKSQGKCISGIWQEGETSRFTITASVQGTCAEVLQTMPEGSRTSATYTLRTSTRLLTSRAGQTTPDIVVIDGEQFFVLRVTSWQNLQIAKHYEVIVAKGNSDED